MNIELRHLRYFVAVAEKASFTAAARRVHVAQQVLSTQVRQLEQAVNVQLLERGSRGVALTPHQHDCDVYPQQRANTYGG